MKLAICMLDLVRVFSGVGSGRPHALVIGWEQNLILNLMQAFGIGLWSRQIDRWV